MKRRVWQWFFFTVLVCSLALASLFLFEDSVADYFFELLESWRDLCAHITPDEWQVQGNILLGLVWLFTGVLAYSMIIGLCCVILLAFAQELFMRLAGKKPHKAK
jgi:hypothetical protein